MRLHDEVYLPLRWGKAFLMRSQIRKCCPTCLCIDHNIINPLVIGNIPKQMFFWDELLFNFKEIKWVNGVKSFICGRQRCFLCVTDTQKRRVYIVLQSNCSLNWNAFEIKTQNCIRRTMEWNLNQKYTWTHTYITPLAYGLMIKFMIGHKALSSLHQIVMIYNIIELQI
jgi:hypothetical protein